MSVQFSDGGHGDQLARNIYSIYPAVSTVSTLQYLHYLLCSIYIIYSAIVSTLQYLQYLRLHSGQIEAISRPPSSPWSGHLLHGTAVDGMLEDRRTGPAPGLSSGDTVHGPASWQSPAGPRTARTRQI